MKKTRLATILSLLLVCVCSLAAFTLTACDGGVKVSFSQTEINVTEGLKTTLVITVEGSEEKPSVESSDTSVATVALIGKMCSVTAVKEGTATVTASVGEAKATCTVHVVKDDTERVTVTLDGQEITTLSLEMGQEKTLTANASKGSPVTWETTNPKIVTVDNGKITAVRTGSVTVTAKVTESIKAEVAVTVTGDYEYYEMEMHDEAYANNNPDKWVYWMENWVNTTGATPDYDNGTINVEFNDNTSENPSQFWMAQLFFKNTKLKAGTRYHLSFKIKSNAAGHVTVNGSVLNIAAEEKTYDVYYVEGSGSSFAMQFAANGYPHDLPAAKVAISAVTWTEDTAQEKLQAPSFTLEDNVITVTDPNEVGVGGYKLYFYDADNTERGSVAVENGKEINLSTIGNGTYTVKLVAVSANIHYIDSDPSETTAQVTVSNDKTEIQYGTQGDAIAAGNTWMYWSNKGYEGGSTPNVTEHYIDGEGVVHLTFSDAGIMTWDVQLAYKDKSLTAGKNYNLTFKMNSTVEGVITVKGTKQELKIGDNEISVMFTETTSDASVYMEFGNGTSSIEKGAFLISNLSITEITSTELKAPSFTLADNVITITDENTEGVGGYVLGLFAGESTTPAATLTVKNGDTIDTSAVANGTYTAKLMAKGESLMYKDSAWSESTAEITVSNDKTVINAGGEADLVSGWCYWAGGPTVSECYLDGDGAVHLTFSGSGEWYGVQLFYKNDLSGKAHKLTLTLNSTVAGKITVNGAVQDIVVGDNAITVENFGGSSVSIQMGVNGGGLISGGTFIFKDIAITAVA